MYNGLCDVMWVQFAKTCRTMNEAKRSDIRTKVLVKGGMRVLIIVLYLSHFTSSSIRPVGWSGDGGGVRETMRVELTSGGGAFPAWGMGERCKLPHRGLRRSFLLKCGKFFM